MLDKQQVFCNIEHNRILKGPPGFQTAGIVIAAALRIEESQPLITIGPITDTGLMAER
jgi:hypothetical protein